MPLRIWLYAVAFFAVMTLYALEVTHFNRYLELPRFFLVAVAVGLVLAAVLLVCIRQRLGQEPGQRIRYQALVVFLSIFFMPLVLSVTNRLLDGRTPEQVSIQLIKKDARYSNRFGSPEHQVTEPNSFFSYFYLDQHMYRIATATDPFPGVEAGHSTTVAVHRGLWGFRYVGFE